LIDFFELFGRRLVAEEVGISCGGDAPGFFKKRDRGMFEDARPFLWAIEDPQDATNDLGRNSYACRQVKSAFEHAFTVITAPVDSREGFLLRRIVRMDPTWYASRVPPAEPGAIRGVALDFPKYVEIGRERSEREMKQIAEVRGKKRTRDVDGADEDEDEDARDDYEAEEEDKEEEEEEKEEEQPEKQSKTKRGKRGKKNKKQKVSTPAPKAGNAAAKKGYFAKGRPGAKKK
jgi:non-canonical poly(A) RNA polymerase PAPD5/7